LSAVPSQKGQCSQKPQGPFWNRGLKKALINIKAAILKENYLEDKLTEEEKDLILAEITGAFKSTPRERLLQLSSYRREGSALIYVSADQ
jgi:hypothetical protein